MMRTKAFFVHLTDVAAMALCTAFVLQIGAGCVGYRLGSSLPSGAETIFIPTFKNQSGEPLVEVELTNVAIREFQRDGTLKISRSENADLVLQCTLRKITLEPLRYDRVDRSKPNEYRLKLDVAYQLKKSGVDSTETIANGDVEGEATFVFAGNLTLAKKNTIPRAAEDLAKKLVEKVVEVW